MDDPVFAALVSRVRIGAHTSEDIIALKALENTDTTNWPKQHVHLYLTNRLSLQHNEKELKTLPSEKIVILAKDSVKDVATQRCEIVVPENLSLAATANLPTKLTVCVDARVMLTCNIDISDHLVNGSTGTIVHVNVNKRIPLSGFIYIKFDNPKSGNKLKSNRIPYLKDCVPIKAAVLPFSLQQRRSQIKVFRKQYPIVVAYAITVHKSQGATFQYMEADLDRSSINPNRLTPLNPGQFYTLLSRGKESGGTKLSNFHEDNIKVNKKALMEIERLRTESLLNPMHPLSTFVSESVISLLNMRSWNLHLSHFLSDPAHINLCDIFCFTETQLQQEPMNDVNDFSDSWNSIFKHTDHGLALCYNSEHIEYVDQFEMTDEIEIMACLLRCDSLMLSDFILVIVYRKPGSTGNFYSRLIEELRKLPTGYRTIVIRYIVFSKCSLYTIINLLCNCLKFPNFGQSLAQREQ